MQGETQVADGVMISVLMLAHNHGPYIRQAVEGVLAQQCDHPFKLWIGEDGSSDQTKAICLELQAEHPDRIEILSSPLPLGMHGNFARLWAESCGEFVAFCEGDDYWCDPLKLQKQMDFFKQHRDCSLCGTFTEILRLTPDGSWRVDGRISPPVLREKYSFQELISAYHFHFSSVMLRRDAVQFPAWFQSTYCVDRPIYLLAAQNGDAGLIPEVTSVYRLHSGGKWSALDMQTKAEQSIHLFKIMAAGFPVKYQKIFRRALGEILWFYAGQALHRGDHVAARMVYCKWFRYASFPDIVTHSRQFAGVLLRIFGAGFRAVEKDVENGGVR